MMTKLKKIVYVFVALAMIGMFATSCERDVIEILEADIKTGEFDEKVYVFEGLKLNGSSANSIEEGKLVYDINKVAFENIMSAKPYELNINLQTSSDEVMPLKLKKWNIFSDDFKITDEEGNISGEKVEAIFYHGALEDDENSIVSVSIFEDELSIMIISKEDTYHLNKSKDGQLVMQKVSDTFDTERISSCGHSEENFLKLNENGVPDYAIQKAAKSGGSHAPIRMVYTIDPSFESYFGSFRNATIYIASNFASAKALYDYWGIPIQLTGYYRKSIFRTSTVNPDNVLEGTFFELEDRFINGSNYWDVNGGLVVIRDSNNNLIGSGLSNNDNFAACGNSAPICEKGHHPNGIANGCGPFHVISLAERNGAPDNYYFIYTLAHELGHNFGIRHEYDGVTGGIMDHQAANVHSIEHPTYVHMYNQWISCY